MGDDTWRRAAPYTMLYSRLEACRGTVRQMVLPMSAGRHGIWFHHGTHRCVRERGLARWRGLAFSPAATSWRFWSGCHHIHGRGMRGAEVPGSEPVGLIPDGGPRNDMPDRLPDPACLRYALCGLSGCCSVSVCHPSLAISLSRYSAGVTPKDLIALVFMAMNGMPARS